MTDNTEAPLLPLPEASAAEKLRARDEHYAEELARIGSAIGYGNAQAILGRLWDEMLHDTYGVQSGRGRMGVTVDDELPPIPKASAKRRRMRSNGAYEMVPAYDVAELKVFGHAAIAKDRASRMQPNSVSGDSVVPPVQPETVDLPTSHAPVLMKLIRAAWKGDRAIAEAYGELLADRLDADGRTGKYVRWMLETLRGERDEVLIHPASVDSVVPATQPTGATLEPGADVVREFADDLLRLAVEAANNRGFPVAIPDSIARQMHAFMWGRPSLFDRIVGASAERSSEGEQP